MKSKKLKILSSVLAGALLLMSVAGCTPEETTVTDTKTITTTQIQTDTIANTITETTTEQNIVTETTTITETETVTVTETAPESVTITDASGREITLELPIERVVYLHSTIAEGLRIIDAWDRVIAVDNYTTDTVLFPGIEEMPVLNYTESGTVDYEAIIELDPDVLLVLPVAGTIDLDEAIAALEPEITVISVFDTSDTETWSTGIELLGTIMQQEEEAQEYIDWCQQIEDNISAVTASLTEEEKPSVFLKTAGWAIEDICTYSNEFGFVEKLMQTTGAINIAADLPSTGGWVQAVDPEWLMTQEYDHILVQVWDTFYPDSVGFNVEDTSVLEELQQELLQMDIFSGSLAAEDGNLYLIDTYFLTTPRYFVMMEYAAKLFHPELFEELDPKATLQEYLTRFMRIDVDLDEGGVFFYPEP